MAPFLGPRARLLSFTLLFAVPITHQARAQPPESPFQKEPPRPAPRPPELPEEDPIRPVVPPVTKGGFQFGSYGRINIATDGRGGTGRTANIVAHGTRVDAESYAEVELRREDTFGDHIFTRAVTTVALLGPFFNFTGAMADSIIVRQLYAQATYYDWVLWVGARMYRGDDIYILNWWPLDNQHTIGGGIGKRFWTDTTINVHAGFQRLNNPFQVQQFPTIASRAFNQTPVTYLDRNHMVETVRVVQYLRNSESYKVFPSNAEGIKFVFYGEAHHLPSGIRYSSTGTQAAELPSEFGWLVGGEVAYWTGKRDTNIGLFVRHARGLAAYESMLFPTTFAKNGSVTNTTETMVALGGNFEWGRFGLLGGAYFRSFRDADPTAQSRENYDEGTIVLRPQLYITENWGIGLEGSYQNRTLATVDPITHGPLRAAVVRGALLPYYSPSGRGSFKRPQIGAVYAITGRNEAARALYPPDDAFAQRPIEHYIGFTTEWWFNSSLWP